jgi:hypothetical protein
MPYELTVSDDYPDSAWGVLRDAPLERLTEFSACRKIELSIVPTLHFEKLSLKRLLRWDQLQLQTGIPIVSSRMREIIESLCPDGVQFFPVLVNAKDGATDDYSFMNILRKCRCLNVEKSRIKYFDYEPRTIMSIDELTFHPNCMGDLHLARLEELMQLVIVSNRMADELRAGKLNGVGFSGRDSH